MNNYITGNTIKTLREKKGLTQGELAEKICVSSKTVSKWETAKGLPDISLIEPLAEALDISVIELMSGEYVTNINKHANVQKMKYYICPVCGNIITAMGDAVVSCCGITLPASEMEDCDEEHKLMISDSENEYYVTIDHEMSKTHYISFIAYVTSGRIEMVKLYPEGSAEARFLRRGHGKILFYCNRHGLMGKRI